MPIGENIFAREEYITDVMMKDHKKGMMLMYADRAKEHNSIYAGVLYGFKKKGIKTKKIRFGYPKEPRATQISKLMGPELLRYKTLENKIKNMRRRWTIEEKKVLSDAVRKYLIAGLPIKWKTISQNNFFRTRKAWELRNHWFYQLDPLTIDKGKWSREDTLTLVKALHASEKTDGKLSYIKAFVELEGKRTYQACLRKWQNIKRVIADRMKVDTVLVTPKFVIDILKTGQIKDI